MQKSEKHVSTDKVLCRLVCTSWPCEHSGMELADIGLKKAQPRSVHVGFVVNSEALGQVFSQHFGFSPSLSFHILLVPHCTTGQMCEAWEPSNKATLFRISGALYRTVLPQCFRHRWFHSGYCT